MPDFDIKDHMGDFKEEVPENAIRVFPGKIQVYLSLILQSSFYILFVIPILLVGLLAGLFPMSPGDAFTLSILMYISAIVYTIIMGWSMGYTWMFYKTIRYFVSDDAVICKTGIVWRKTITVPYQKITNVDVSQGPLQRWRKIGNVEIQTASGRPGQGGSMAEITFKGIVNPNEVRDIIMKHVQNYSRGKQEKVEPEKNIEVAERTVKDSNINEQILVELKAIRQLLEKNSNAV